MTEIKHTTDTTTEPAAPAAPIIPTETTTPSPEMEALQKENAELKFNADLSKVAVQYPKAADYMAEIKEKAEKSGISVEDATLLVLHNKNALVAPEAPKRDAMAGAGGSMGNLPAREQEDQAPPMGTPEAATYWADKFKEQETAGGIVLS